MRAHRIGRATDQMDEGIKAREVPFLRKAMIGATVATMGAFVWDFLVPHAPPPILPFGQPWLSIVGGAVVWAVAFTRGLVGRLAYLAIKDPYR
jgi:hypothetical protein